MLKEISKKSFTKKDIKKNKKWRYCCYWWCW